MSEPKHTPGPWTVDPDYPQDVRGGGYDIASAPYSRDAGTTWEMRGRFPLARQAVANARLISAAPELLAALQAARTELERYEQERTGETYNNLQINAAIAKALGT